MRKLFSLLLPKLGRGFKKLEIGCLLTIILIVFNFLGELLGYPTSEPSLRMFSTFNLLGLSIPVKVPLEEQASMEQ